jgi:hypothetical protein
MYDLCELLLRLDVFEDGKARRKCWVESWWVEGWLRRWKLLWVILLRMMERIQLLGT